MGWKITCKLLQKQILDVLSQRHGTLIIITMAVLLIVSCIQFGEVLLEWSEEKYAAVFNSFSDNIASKSFQNRLCMPVPIDVVYTWVNGTDPLLLKDLNVYKRLAALTDSDRQHDDRFTGSPCLLQNCAPVLKLAISPPFPTQFTLQSLAILYPVLQHAHHVRHVHGSHGQANVSVLSFDDEIHLNETLHSTFMVSGQNATVHRMYMSLDWTLDGGYLSDHEFVLTGLPPNISVTTLQQAITQQHLQYISKIEIYEDHHFALVNVTNAEILEEIIDGHNITIEGVEYIPKSVNLVWNLTTNYFYDDVVAANRFEDNEELRYSLRSLQQHAPWVRHVYIVTNGQIPYWMNLDAPRLTLITHQELFPNASHLPTFSSPAIESHLHRIPGLSKRFIYMNDDVMFGSTVWPEDFYTHTHGQKIYLAWAMPNCQDGCPSTWIKDGYCDKACNNSECDWDGGDCNGTSKAYGWGGSGSPGAWSNDIDYCSTGCATSWVADRYCDQACNVLSCGFDAGDCGLENYHQMHEVVLTPHQSPQKHDDEGGVIERRAEAMQGEHVMYYVSGEHVFYINTTSVFPTGALLKEGSYSKKGSGVIRTMVLGQKLNVVTVILVERYNYTEVGVEIVAHLPKDEEQEGKEFTYNLTLCISPIKTKPDVDQQHQNDGDGYRIEAVEIDGEQANGEATATKGNSTHSQHPLLYPEFVFKPVAEDIRSPKVREPGSPVKSEAPRVNHTNHDLDMFVLPDFIQMELDELNAELHNGDLTEKGFDKRQDQLWIKYREYLQAEKLDMMKKPNSSNNKTDNGEEPRALPEIDGTLGNERHEDSNFANATEAKRFVDKEPLVSNVSDTHKGRKLQAVVDFGAAETYGFLPWENTKRRDRVDAGAGSRAMVQDQQAVQNDPYATHGAASRRHLLDTYVDSIRYVNKLYNTHYGITARKIPAHSPHLIDKDIMVELQQKFSHQFEATSSHHFRHSQDMQYAFSYYYYIASEMTAQTPASVFDIMDVDHSGVLSDRELRTFATRVFETPLTLQMLTSMENAFINCSKHLPANVSDHADKISDANREEYYDKEMPQVTKILFENCNDIVKLTESKFTPVNKYKHEIMDDSDLSFKMIHTNVSKVVGQLDDIRRNPRKFICLNDDIDHTKEHAQTVKAVVQDFYEALYPTPSSFELPREYRNRFLHLDELKEWRRYRDWLKTWTYLAFGVLVMFTVASFIGEKCERVYRRMFSARGSTRASSATDKPSIPEDVV